MRRNRNPETVDRQALSLPPSGAIYRGGGRFYFILYIRQVLGNLWKTSYRLRWWLGGLLAVMGSGVLGGLPLWALLTLLALALVGTFILLGGVRGARFDPVSMESLWTRYGGLPHNPWRIVRDRPAAPHVLWDAHLAWAHDTLRNLRLPRIPWGFKKLSRIELAAVAVVVLVLGLRGDPLRDVSDRLNRIPGVTQVPSLQAEVAPPEGFGLPTQTLPSPPPFLRAPVGSTLSVTFNTPQRMIPYAHVGDSKIRLHSKDGQTWKGILDTPASGFGQIHLGFVSSPMGSIAVLADQPPQIQWRGQPTADSGEGLTLPYQALDDFGLQVIMAHSRLVNPLDVAPAFRDMETWDVTRFDTPPYPMGGAEETATLEGAGAYAAGHAVDLSLSARDAMGQMGETQTRRVVWPVPTHRTPAAAQLYQIRAGLIAGGGDDTGPAIPLPNPDPVAPARAAHVFGHKIPDAKTTAGDRGRPSPHRGSVMGRDSNHRAAKGTESGQNRGIPAGSVDAGPLGSQSKGGGDANPETSAGSVFSATASHDETTGHDAQHHPI